MKIVILNGSPRKGNTVTAINSLIEGINGKHEVEVIDTYKVNVGPCMACGVCQMQNGCVAKDDTNMVIDKLAAADMLVFATPVYWWGITAQIKLVLDKLYCRGLKFKGKKAGVIAVGGSPVDSEQYKLIRGQFKCIADYLEWDMVFHKDYYATDKDDLAKDMAALEELKATGAAI